jgi:hypothetical protein
MSQTEDKMINELVTELLDDVKTSENKESTADSIRIVSEPIPSNESDKKEYVAKVGSNMQMPQIDLAKVMPEIDMSQANKLFSGLIKSFIPPELKKNKDVQKMFDMFFSDPNSKKETTVKDKDAQENVKEENEDVEDDQEEDIEDIEDEQVENDDVEDEQEEVEDEQEGDDEEDEQEGDDEEEQVEDEQDSECDCDCNNCEIDNCDSCVYESVKYAFVIMWDDKPIAYTKKFTNAQKYMNKLYRNLLMKHANVFTKTVRELGSIRVYERKVYTLFPFQDTLMAHFSIKQIPNV